VSKPSQTNRIVVGLIGGVIVALLVDVLNMVARGHWLSLSHAVIVGVVAAVIIAMIPWRPALRR
jgi:uncharacterized membrane protein YeaQ/YmgE (transglycosylase-associated protein family)